MAIQIISGASLLYDGYNFSGHHNEIQLNHTAEAKDATTIDQTSRVKIPGLRDTVLTSGGYFEAGADLVDPVYFGDIAGTGKPVSVILNGITEGNEVHFFEGLTSQYSPGGTIADTLPFKFTSTGKNRLVKGTLMDDETVTAPGTGTAYQLGALAANQYLVVCVHTLSSTGSIQAMLNLYSDDNSGMTSATSRWANIVSRTAKNAEIDYTTVAGAITDDWWRFSWSDSGSGSISFVTMAGIITV